MADKYFCVHGHFYQPVRYDPFTGEIPREAGAEPYKDFNEKINAECYRPNAQARSFDLISFNLGPTLADWLERNDPETYHLILAADRKHFNQYGHGNAMAQAYNHTILPLANSNEKRIQIAWGIADFKHRFGHSPEGMWLAETAVDYESICMMANKGIKFTILAPWQAATGIDTTEPYRVFTCDGQQIVVFFFDDDLNLKIGYDDTATIDADYFASEILRSKVNWDKLNQGLPSLNFIATDGEVYGHHKPYRDQFLRRLIMESAPREGFEVLTLGCYFHRHEVVNEVHIADETSWSCFHGVRRWQDRDDCAGDQNDWKKRLREALNRLAEKIDDAYCQVAAKFQSDPWEILENYVQVKLGTMAGPDLVSRYGADPNSQEGQSLITMLECQYFRQLMFTSCGFFFEDLDRIEPYNDIAFAAKAIDLAKAVGFTDFEQSFINDLEAARSWKTGRTGKDAYYSVLARRTSA